jgi:glyoxylase I family protein
VIAAATRVQALLYPARNPMPNDDLKRAILELEERLLTQDVRTSRQALDGLLADDFVEIGASGNVYNKASIIEALLTEMPRQLTVSEFKVREMSTDQAHAMYRATDGATGSASNRSSVWRYEQGVWRMAFHRGTPITRP